MSVRNKISIIISAYQRQYTLQRICEYYKSFPVQKIVVDSSPREYAHRDRLQGVDYFHTPDRNFYENIKFALSRCNTPFVVHVNDDDFVLISAIKRCTEFLSNHSDFVLAQGLNVKFFEQGCLMRNDYGCVPFLHHIKHPPERSITDRIERLFANFHTLNHAVFRTDVLSECYDLVLRNDHLKPIRFFDKIIGYVSAVFGKLKFMPLLYQLRSESRLFGIDVDYPAELEKDVGFAKILSRLEEGDPLSRLLEQKTDVNLQQSKQFTKEIFRDYIRKRKEQREGHRTDSLFIKFISVVKTYFPVWIQSRINFFLLDQKYRKLYLKMFNSKSLRDEMENILHLVKRYR